MEQSEKYEEGYAIGLTWNHDWIPGGPWVGREPYRSQQNYEQKLKYYEESVKANRDWKQGWNDGVAFAKENKCT